MSVKNLDSKNRWRSKIISFRMSPEEAKLLDSFVRSSGFNKQDYLINRVLQTDIVVKGNAKTIKGIRNELSALNCELQRLNTGENIDDEVIILIKFITTIIYGMVVKNDA